MASYGAIPAPASDFNIEKASYKEIEQHKNKTRENVVGFDEEDGTPVIKDHPDGVTSLYEPGQLVRGTCFFRNCIARDPRTPINEMHIGKPVCLFLVGLSCTLLVIAPMCTDAWLYKLLGLTLILLFSSSFVLLVVGRVAKTVLPLETQVADLIDENDKLAAGATKEADLAGTAEELDQLSLDLISSTVKQRNAMKDMQANFVARQRKFCEMDFKAQQMARFWTAETQSYTHHLRKGESTAEMPNGLLSIDELHRLVKTLKRQGKDYNFVDDLIVQIILTDLDLHAQRDTFEWSYSEIIDKMIAKAKEIGDKKILEQMGLDMKSKDKHMANVTSALASGLPAKRKSIKKKPVVRRLSEFSSDDEDAN